MEPEASQEVDVGGVEEYLQALQERICAAFTAIDGTDFTGAPLPGDRGGLAWPRQLSEGAVFEKAVVLFSHAAGETLPEAAVARRPELRGAAYDAVSMSLVTHPRNPYVPTAHANLRLFSAHRAGEPVAWWFGGGMDLTPCYLFAEDVAHWHATARAACDPFGADLYPRYERQCDEYFFLPHRGETRGVGGLFFDDLAAPGFAACFAFVRSVGDAFLPAYLPLVERRQDTPYGERERRFQLFRRGRYAEFNLLYDRGTRFGLQTRARVDSVLASLPPLAAWPGEWHAEPGSPEERLLRALQSPRERGGSAPSRDSGGAAPGQVGGTVS